MSAGIFVAAGSQLQQANGEAGLPEELAEDIFQLNDRQSDIDVTLALCRVSGPMIDWLVFHNVPLEHMPNYRYPGMSRSWIHSTPERHGSVIIESLNTLIRRQSNIDLHLGTGVTNLISEGGAVTGLKAMTTHGDPLTVKAKSVILAASGFGANRTMVSRYIPAMINASYFGSPYATGDAIKWGQELGAAVDNMSAYQSHSSIAHPQMMLVTTYLINLGAIQVNQQGYRFGDETETYAGHAVKVQQQPGRNVVELFDERILRLTLTNYPRFSECLAAGIVHQSETLAEMAHKFNLNKENLIRTVEEYNAAISVGSDQFGRTQFGKPIRPPYYGIRVTSALVQTLGGLRIDARARVLRNDGTMIPGLYAGGGTAVGFSGVQSEGYLAGTGLLAAFGLGWIAGHDAA